MRKRDLIGMICCILCVAACQRVTPEEGSPDGAGAVVGTEAPSPGCFDPEARYQVTYMEDAFYFLTLSEEGEIEEKTALPVSLLSGAAGSVTLLFGDSTHALALFSGGERVAGCLTSDGGKNWEEAAIPKEIEEQSLHAAITCAAAIGATEYCVGYRYWGTDTSTSFYLTRDNGFTWDQVDLSLLLPDEISSQLRYTEPMAAFAEEEKLFVQLSCKVTDPDDERWSIEVMFVSSDQGETWQITRDRQPDLGLQSGSVAY